MHVEIYHRATGVVPHLEPPHLDIQQDLPRAVLLSRIAIQHPRKSDTVQQSCWKEGSRHTSPVTQCEDPYDGDKISTCGSPALFSSKSPMSTAHVAITRERTSVERKCTGGH
jgi:hypothetical protein